MSERLEEGRQKLLLWTNGGLIAATWFLILVWLISGDLAWETAVIVGGWSRYWVDGDKQ